MTTTDRHGNALPFSPLTQPEIDRRASDESRHITLAVARDYRDSDGPYALMGDYPYEQVPLRQAAQRVMDYVDAGYQRRMGRLPELAVTR